MSSSPTRPTYTYTEEDWVQLRSHFMGSILVDIHLHKLAQNIGATWPAKGKDETPAKYLEYSFEELAEAPGLAGQPKRLQLLFNILKETAAFDDPFQNMMEAKPNSAKAAANSDQLLKKLGISPKFPIEFTAISSETKQLCQGEGASTIGECVTLLQGMAQNVILGGEVRQLLNSLAHTDERVIASFLPFRLGSRGLHLAEAIGIAIRNLPEKQRVAWLNPSPAPREVFEATDAQLTHQLRTLLQWFPEEATKLQEIATSGQPVERFFHSLNDATIENAAARIIQQLLAPTRPDLMPVEETPTTGLMNRVTSFFRSKH